MLLLKMDMNKLFKFYWKKEEMLIFQLRLFCWFSFSFCLFFKENIIEMKESIFVFVLGEKRSNTQNILTLHNFYFNSFFLFFLNIFLFLILRVEQLLFLLLLNKDMNKLLKFYWKKENKTLIFQIRFFCWFFFSFFFSFSVSFVVSFSFFFFSFSFFYFFVNVKKGRTPLYIAAEEGYELILQLRFFIIIMLLFWNCWFVSFFSFFFFSVSHFSIFWM